MTDASVDDAALEVADAAQKSGFRVSVLAVATREGDPVRLPDGSLLEDQAGNIAVTRMDEPGLKQLASTGGGTFQELAVDSRDVDGLINANQAIEQSLASELDRTVMQWVERGPWVLLVLLIGVLPVFRRGVL